MKINSILKLSLFFSLLYFDNIGKGSAVSPGETIQHFHINQNYHRVKKNGMPRAPLLSKPKQLENGPQKLLVRAKRLDLMEVARNAKLAEANRLAKLVQGSKGSSALLVRTKRRELVKPIVKRQHQQQQHHHQQLKRVKRLSLSNHHSNHHPLGDRHHEVKKHTRDTRFALGNNHNNKEYRWKVSHAKKPTHFQKKSHDRHDVKSIHNAKREVHLKRDLHRLQDERYGHHQKTESRLAQRSPKLSVYKEKKEKKHVVHKTGGGHGSSHSGHDSSFRNPRVNHNKWKKNAKKHVTVAAPKKLNTLKKSKKRKSKQ